MKIKMLKNWVDEDSDTPYAPKSIVEASDGVAEELIKSGHAELYVEPVREIQTEDIGAKIGAEVKSAIAEAMKDIKTEEKVITPEDEVSKDGVVQVTEDAPIWKDGAEFLSAVHAAANGNVDEKLFKSTGQNETTDADGGYLVEHRIGNEIYQAAAQASVLLPKCSRLEIGPNANGMKINQVNESERSATTLFGGVRVYSPTEGVAKTAFKQAYSQVDIDLGKLCAVSYVTDELLQDRVALQSFIKGNVGNAIGWVIDDDVLHGTTNTALQEIEDHASTVQFTVAGANPTALELAGMFASMLPGSIGKAEWYMSLSQYVACMQLEDTSGRKLIQPSFEVAAYGTLFGRPVNVIEQADIDANDTSIMFLDLSQYLIIAKGGIDEAQSIHVKFLEDETAFRWTMRMGGAPKLASTITLPSTDVVSCFVTRD